MHVHQLFSESLHCFMKLFSCPESSFLSPKGEINVYKNHTIKFNYHDNRNLNMYLKYFNFLIYIMEGLFNTDEVNLKFHVSIIIIYEYIGGIHFKEAEGSTKCDIV